MSYAKDAKKFVRDLCRSGDWEHLGFTGKCHYKLRHKSGRIMTMSLSPSDRRWTQRVQQDIRRIEREAGYAGAWEAYIENGQS